MSTVAIGGARGSGTRKSDVILVTACERNYFLLACLLMHSLRRWAPELPLYVLDFGMDPAQRRFLRGYCTVLERPADMAPNLHPFIYKAAMARFLKPIKWRTMVWLDSDMIAVGPLGKRLKTVVAELAASKREVALAQDTLSTFGALIGSGHKVDGFARAVAEAGIDRGAPYYNTGFFVCISPEFLKQWAEAAKSGTIEVNFDQNVFNVLLHRRMPPMELDTREWNLHGPMLAAAKVATDGGVSSVMVDDKTALVLHTTSPRRDDISNVKSIEIAGVRLRGQLYLCRNPALLALQQTVMTEFFSRAADKLRRSGLAEPMAVNQ